MFLGLRRRCASCRLIVRIATRRRRLQPASWPAMLLLIVTADHAAGRATTASALQRRDRAEAAHRRPAGAAARREAALPRRRGARPRRPTAPRRSSSPPPATTCASRCTPWACSPRRCASASHDARGGAAGQQHQRARSMRSRACSPNCSTSPASTPAASRCSPQHFEVRRHPAQAAPALRADRLREGPGAAPARRSRAWCTPTRCWSSASCATWSPTPSATPTTAACWSARAPRGDTGAAAGVGHRHRHPRRGAAAHLRGVLPGAAARAAVRAAPAQGPGPGPGDRQAAGRPDGRAADAALARRPRHACSR